MSSTFLKVIAASVFVLGIGVMASGDPEESPLPFVGAGMMFVAGHIYFRSRQVAARSRNIGPESPLYDARPDVVYLRGFHADPSKLHKRLVTGFTTEEEDLATAVSPIGDLIAIGQPGEPLPLPGAARVYCSEDEWRDVVSQRMRVAPLVIIRAGRGDGLLWECERAFAMLSPGRLVILVMNLRANEYEQFAAAVRSRLGIMLPAIPRFTALSAALDLRNNPLKVTPGFIIFSKGWRAEFVPIPLKIMKFGHGDLVKPFQQALRPVFAAALVSREHNSGARQYADAPGVRKKGAALRIDSET